MLSKGIAPIGPRTCCQGRRTETVNLPGVGGLPPSVSTPRSEPGSWNVNTTGAVAGNCTSADTVP